MTELALEKPSLTIQISDDRIVKLSYGLQQDLQRFLPDATAVMQLLMNDPYTQDIIVRRVLTDFKGTITDNDQLVKAEDVDVPVEKTEEIITWVAKHLLYFFGQRTRALIQAGRQFKTDLPNLSTDGSENSTSTTPAAGPSDVSKES